MKQSIIYEKAFEEVSKYRKSGESIADMVNREPNLPIYAMVDTDVVAGDDYSSWCGEFRKAEFDGLYYGREKTWRYSEVIKYGTRLREFFKQEAPDSHIDLANKLGNTEEITAFMRWWVDSLNWTKCILLYIGTPDSL